MEFKFKAGVAEGLLGIALCAVTGALGFLTAQKVDEIKTLKERSKYSEIKG